jgi:hypothetical protein
MSGIASMFAGLDLLCGQVAAALQHAALHIYTTLALLVVLSVLLFPPRDDLDQI